MIDNLAHAVHVNMYGHTKGIMLFGMGKINQKFSKQKMNTCSSTETDHITTSKYLPKPTYFEIFMSSQGYNHRTR